MAPADYLSELIQDARYAMRTLGRAPAFTAAAMFTLAIGMAGTISMFALVEGVLFRPLPVRTERELFVGWQARPEAGARHWPFTTAGLDLLRDESRLLEGVAGVGYNDPQPIPMLDNGDAAFVHAARVTGDFFRVLGVAPLIGRALGPNDNVAGAESALVITHALWQRRYGGSSDVLGRRVMIEGQPFTIVGVMPRDIDHPRHVEAWMTVTAMQKTTSNPTAKQAMSLELDLLARLRPGVTTMHAEAELRALAPQLEAQNPAGDQRGLVPALQSFREFVIGDVRPALVVLFAAVGLVLLIASASVSNLLLVRGEARMPEFAVRAALGAGRGRIVRQLLAEGGVLALGAGSIALAAVSSMLPIVLRRVPDGFPRVEAIRVDASLVVFSIAVALFVASLAALAPALASTRHQLNVHLRNAGRGGASGARRGRRALVIGQVALAVIGVAAAGLLTSSLRRLQDVGARLASDQLVYVPLALPQDKYADRARLRRFVTDLAGQLEATPIIAAATPINVIPFTGLGWDVPTFTAEGQSEDEAKANPTLNFEEIHPRYFTTFEVGLVRGRAFTDYDREGATRVAIVSEDVAARAWPGQDAIGKRLKMGGPSSPDSWWTVVGVAAPTRYRELREARATLYVPAQQLIGAAEHLVVRTSAAVPLVADLVRAQARLLDPAVHVMPLRPFSQLLDVPLARPRFYAALVTLFGATGVTLAVVGLYGVLSASVRHRRREIAVRMALGAEPRDVRRLVLADGAGLVCIGIVLGLALTVLTTGALRSLLFEVGPLDPSTLASAVGILLVVAGLALYPPVRRAGRIDPGLMLRAE